MILVNKKNIWFEFIFFTRVKCEKKVEESVRFDFVKVK